VAAGAFVARLPSAFSAREPVLSPAWLAQGPAIHRPVVCVHGFAASARCWSPLAQELTREGFAGVHAFSYNTLTGDPGTAARALSTAVERLLADTGHDYVHLVGHSLGGLVVRAATERGGLWPRVAAVVTVATPHRGSSWSRLAPGPTRTWLRMGVSTLPDHEPARPAYLNYHCPDDAVVPSASAVLLRPGVHNHALPGVGHLGAASAPLLLADLPGRLRAVEARRAGTTSAPDVPLGRTG
jgi:pimeloyl-ACP methyl ester carboxylesterase